MPIDLMTKQGESLLASKETPWQVYPRPQMRRDSYVNLNGGWEFSAGSADFSQTIRIPFCPESQLSGVQQHFPEGQPLHYRRKFTLRAGFCQGRILLHIGAADQVAKIYVNQHFLAEQLRGSWSLTLQMTESLLDENELLSN